MSSLDTGQVKNSKNSKFYFEEYIDRKRKILDSIDKKKRDCLNEPLKIVSELKMNETGFYKQNDLWWS